MYSWWWVGLSPETCRVKHLERLNHNCCISLELFHYYYIGSVAWKQLVATLNLGTFLILAWSLQMIPHRGHIVSQLRIPVGYWWLGESSLPCKRHVSYSLNVLWISTEICNEKTNRTYQWPLLLRQCASTCIAVRYLSFCGITPFLYVNYVLSHKIWFLFYDIIACNFSYWTEL